MLTAQQSKITGLDGLYVYEVVLSIEVLVDDRLHVSVLLRVQSEAIVEASNNLHLYLFESVS